MQKSGHTWRTMRKGWGSGVRWGSEAEVGRGEERWGEVLGGGLRRIEAVRSPPNVSQFRPLPPTWHSVLVCTSQRCGAGRGGQRW